MLRGLLAVIALQRRGNQSDLPVLVLQAVESLAAVADSNMSHTGVLARDGCVDSLLSVLAHANAASSSCAHSCCLIAVFGPASKCCQVLP